MAYAGAQARQKKYSGSQGKENGKSVNVHEANYCTVPNPASSNFATLNSFGFPEGTIVQAYQYSPQYSTSSNPSVSRANYPQATLSTNHISQSPRNKLDENVNCGYSFSSNQHTTPPSNSPRGNGGPSPRNILPHSVSNNPFPSTHVRLSPQSQSGCVSLPSAAIARKFNSSTPPAPATRPSPAVFQAYVSSERKEAGLAVGLLVEGQLVISCKSPDEAYVRVPGKTNEDINVSGVKHRNRALNGDIVVVEIFPKSLWKIRPDCVETVQAQLGIESLGECKSKDDIQQLIIVSKKKANDALNIEAIEDDALSHSSPEDNSSTEPTTPPAPPQKKNSPRSWQKQGQKWMDILVGNIGLQNIPEKWLQKTGKVVFVTEMKGVRKVVGTLINTATNNAAGWDNGHLMLKPCDARMPLVRLPVNGIPLELKSTVKAPRQKNDVLYLAEIIEWTAFQFDPIAKLIKYVGTAGNIDTFTTIMMTENGVEEEDFPVKTTKELIRDNRLISCQKEQRQDFREECVFTIDPPDAKDLDDAVSCHRLGNGVYRVGVHISDVSYVVTDGSDLDKYAAQRATTVYMINKVVHMLPPKLIEATCSLDAGVDRRTLSVIFTLTEEGEMLDYEVMRGVIRSCAKLSYRQAQDNIEGAEAHLLAGSVVGSTDQIQQVSDTIKDLHLITQAMRAQRIHKGCLRIDQPQFYYKLDEAGMPIAMQCREHWASCQLIEELALLTNMVTAQMIYARYPEVALLRRHPEPLASAMESMQKLCQLEKMAMSTECAKSIQESMSLIVQHRPELLPVISYLCAKPMQLAEYICTGVQSDTWHYALGVEHYTHMTSPIRRYPDIIVHRLLSSLLGYTDKTSLTVEKLQEIAGVCNERKYGAKRCQEASGTLYMGLYISRHGPLVEEGVVVAVYGASLSLDILVPRLALAHRVFVQKVAGVSKVVHRVTDQRHFLDVQWKKGSVMQSLTVWKSVTAIVSVAFEEVRNIKISLQQPASMQPPQIASVMNI